MKFKTCLVFLCVLLAFAGQAYALAITPSTGVLNTTRWQGNENSTPAIDAVIAPIISPAVELYKNNVGEADSGILAGSYETTFIPPTDPGGANISYVGGDIVGPPAYLLVKDGNQEPAWYLFYLTALGWDGMDTLNLSGFWPAQGAISHVTLYGTRSVPEPSTLLLLGLGVGGLFMARRKMQVNR